MLIKRCKPLLGTFVEITAECGDESLANHAIQAAFEAIERVETHMSIYNSESEISRLNRMKANQEMNVSDDTYTVLKQATQLFELTNGRFDCAYHSQNASTKDMMLLPNNRIRFSKPLLLNLGGIAKGFAVDLAIETLLNHGFTECCVNAGGDLRYSGETRPTIWNRLAPNHYEKNEAFFHSRLKAMATSFPSENHQGLADNRHIHGITKEPVVSKYSVTVLAETCMVADALTKVVMIMGESSQSILEKMNAIACVTKIEE